MTARRRIIAAAFVALIGLMGVVDARGDEVIIAAASSMRYPLAELIERFERETGHTVRLSLGSSGSFFAQISNGAPFDIYLAADAEYPRRLGEDDLVEPGSFAIYGTGRIALWAPADSPLEVERLGMDALVDPRVRRIAIANPRLAPYGAAALEAMESAGIAQAVSLGIVRAENIAQAAQFVSSGAADVGVIAMSLVRSPQMSEGRIWEIPEGMHAPIEQGVVILRRARRSGHYTAARAFVDMLGSPEGRRILEAYGLSVP